MKYGAFLLTLLLVAFSAHVTFAQASPLGASMNDVSVSVAPQNPQANQLVTLTIISYLVKLGSADISWVLDGKTTRSGVGMTSFSFTTKNVGETSTIDLTILPIGGSPITKHMTITPSSLDILWEVVGSATPPFYKGKALPVAESDIKFVAMPNIKNVNGGLFNNDDMIYNWTNNFDIDKADSGYGKNSYEYKIPITDDSATVGVTASLRGGGLSAYGQVTTNTFDPKIVWYTASALYGPQFNKALGSDFTVTSNDISIFAEPYYVSTKNITADTLSYSWDLNNTGLDAQTPPNILSLHRDIMNKGDAVIDLVIENSQRALEELKSSITLHLQ